MLTVQVSRKKEERVNKCMANAHTQHIHQALKLRDPATYNR